MVPLDALANYVEQPPFEYADQDAASDSPAPEPDRLLLAPFRATRYTNAVDLSAVVSPPYDLVSDDDLARLRAAEPHNAVRLILPEATPEAPPDDPQSGRYRRAAQAMADWFTDGVLRTDDEPALYVYEHAEPGPDGVFQPVQRGLIGGIGLSRPETGVVLPHENVLNGPVEDRLRLMTATQANLEPIFLLYDGGGTASAMVDDTAASGPPLCEAWTSAHTRHRLWPITDRAELDAIAADLAHRQALIADGHHRYATYLRLRDHHHAAGHGAGPWDYGLTLLVDSLAYPPKLGAIHRVLPDLPPERAVRALRTAFTVDEARGKLPELLERLTEADKDGPAFLVSGNGRHWLATAPDPDGVSAAMPAQRSARWRALNTSILHVFVIPKLWGIEEDEDTVRIVHHDAAEAVRRASATGGTAVILPPLRVPDVTAVAADGEKVPRKSTSFGPKPPTGLAMRVFAAQP
jgi:uncharacterized protein (DUF1015 family)